MVKAGSTMWNPTVKANCARASRTASAPDMPTSRPCRPDHYGGRSKARKGSCSLAHRLRPDLGNAADPYHLTKVALDQMHCFAGHRLHRDFDVHRLAGAVRPHAVRHQIALGEWLQKAGEQAWRTIRIEHEADGDGWPRGRGRSRIVRHEGNSGRRREGKCG